MTPLRFAVCRRLIWIACLAWLPLQAFAHAILVEAKPGQDEKLTQPPASIVLRFDAPVGKRYLAIAVVDQNRRRVDAGDAARDLLDGSIVRASLKQPLPPGNYYVRYRVQSEDTHIVTGSYQFTVSGESHAETSSKPWPHRLLEWFTRH
jgi:methionine-rich copper-binding protein CopC